MTMANPIEIDIEIPKNPNLNVFAEVPPKNEAEINPRERFFTTHNELLGRSEHDAHPIEAISGLRQELDSKQGDIQDLDAIRSNAAAGKQASETISTYGDIVTHNKNEFATAAQGAKADTAVQPRDLPVVNDKTLTVKRNGSTLGTFSANSSVDKTIDIPVPTSAADVNALPNTTKYGASLYLSLNPNTFKITAWVEDQDGNRIGEKCVIDLPLESVVVGGSYDSQNKKIVLTLENGTTIDVPVGDLVAGLQTEITAQNKLSADLVDDSSTTNKFVTQQEKQSWNGKQDALGYTAENSGNKVTSLSNQSTDTQYPSAKCVHDGLAQKANTSDLPTNFVGTDGVEDGAAGLVPAPESYQVSYYLKSNGSWSQISYYDLTDLPTIPTSADYWTIATDQTSSGKKMINYTQSSAQDNGFRVIAKSDTPPVSTVGAWSARVMFGNEKRTFLMGTARNTTTPTQSICGIGAHTWGSATSQTSAQWDNVYFQPDGSTGTYLGGNGWRSSSGWFRVLNNNSGNAGYRVTINTGTAASPTWRTVLPNQASGTGSIQMKNDVSATFSYNYATSVGGTITANYGSSFGYGSSAAGYALALGYSAVASGSYAIQLGYGTNNTANTLNVGLSSSLNVQLLNSSGKIPAGRLPISTSVDSSSTNDTVVSAKLLYDTVGDIETLLYNINSGS